MHPSPSLAGKTAIVTGASSGIGRAIAEKVGAAGAHVYLAGRTRAAMDASKARVEETGGRATARHFDPAVVAGFVQATGMQVDIKRGERLPDEVMEKLQPAMRKVLASPDDIADAVLYAVTQPIHLNVAELVVRPAKHLNV